MISGVLFDMDGLLLDTERLGFQLLGEVYAARGYELTPELYASILGCTHPHSKKIMSERFGPDFPFDELFAMFDQRLLEVARAGKLPLKKGMEECIAGLKQRGIRRALATGTQRAVVECYIANTPALQNAFDAVVCGLDVRHSKPAPDIYLEAARQLALAPGACMGVEDSRNGLMSLTAAGCLRVMIPDLVPYDPTFAGIVNYKLDDLSQLCGLIDRVNLAARVRG